MGKHERKRRTPVCNAMHSILRTGSVSVPSNNGPHGVKSTFQLPEDGETTSFQCVVYTCVCVYIYGVHKLADEL
jgi:hypothetical protein